ncbi:MAG: hypothetical protein LBN95_06175 [Prevotellaceae bacterium]|jgi:hypothetical protein|nr:hypothetical protein [Prevotellaceae bacterium]
MNTETIYNNDDARYTDAPPEVDAAIDYAIEHNLIYTRQEFERLLEQSKQTSAPKPRSRFSFPNLRKVAAM